MTFRKLAYGASAVAIMMSASTAVYAQETTGGISGAVYDAAGAPVAGATVTVTHEPSGTTSTTVTDQNGSFSSRGLRVGGPYTVRSTSSAGDAVAQVATIGIGTPASVELVVAGAADSAAQVADVVVTGVRSGGLRTSPRSNLNLADIETLRRSVATSRTLFAPPRSPRWIPPTTTPCRSAARTRVSTPS